MEAISSAVHSGVHSGESLAHLNLLRTDLSALQKARSKGQTLSDVKSKALTKAQHHIIKMSNTHVKAFFEEFRAGTKQGGKWQFIREERGFCRLLRFGHTKTYQRIVTLLQERAVVKYRESRQRHGENSLRSDESKISDMLDYNRRRYDPLNYMLHLRDRANFQEDISQAQSRVAKKNDRHTLG